MAESRDGLGITLTPVQHLLMRLIEGSREGLPAEVVLEGGLSSAFKELVGLIEAAPRLWLPPGSSVEARGDRVSVRFEAPITAFLCVAGRRSGKTTLASILMAWLARLLLLDKSFLEGVPILPDSAISLLNVACDEHQARLLFRMLMANLRELGLLPEDARAAERVELGPSGRLVVESLSSSARSARGRTACGACFDEFAHFQRTSGPLADRSMWLALKPSVATFGDKSLVCITTTPSGRSGVVWDLFQERGNRRGMLAVQLPTWRLNPHVSREALDDEFKRDETLARQEYGAEFLAPHGAFLKADGIRACVRSGAHPAPSRASRHLHVDLGLRHDATAMALGYLDKSVPDEHGQEPGWRVVIERLDVLQSPSGDPLSVAEIERRVVELAEEAPIRGVSFDQHQSAYLIERLKARGIPAREFPATAKSNQEVFAFLRDLISTGRISLPESERLIRELEELECTPTSWGFKVCAPPGGGDDCADAVACCAWCLAHEIGDWRDMLSVFEPGGGRL